MSNLRVTAPLILSTCRSETSWSNKVIPIQQHSQYVTSIHIQHDTWKYKATHILPYKHHCHYTYLVMCKVNLSFDKHTQSYIWSCVKSTFPLTNILKVIFGHVQSQKLIFLLTNILKVIFGHV
jgi:hypothetical protein